MVRISGEVSDEDEIDDVYLAAVESSDPGEATDVLGVRSATATVVVPAEEAT